MNETGHFLPTIFAFIGCMLALLAILCATLLQIRDVLRRIEGKSEATRHLAEQTRDHVLTLKLDEERTALSGYSLGRIEEMGAEEFDTQYGKPERQKAEGGVSFPTGQMRPHEIVGPRQPGEQSR